MKKTLIPVAFIAIVAVGGYMLYNKHRKTVYIESVDNLAKTVTIHIGGIGLFGKNIVKPFKSEMEAGDEAGNGYTRVMAKKVSNDKLTIEVYQKDKLVATKTILFNAYTDLGKIV